MRGLIKADFKRVFADKLLLVIAIIAAAFAVMTPVLYSVIFSFVDMPDELTAGMFYAKSQFFQSFSIGNNLGLIAPVLLAIIMYKDFSFGTVRNKVIMGKTRTQIFLSSFVVSTVMIIVIMLVHAFLSFGISLIFFEYQSSPFTLDDFWYFLTSLGFEILALLFIGALLAWLCAVAKNVGLVIVLYVAVAFGLVMLGSVTRVGCELIEMSDASEFAKQALNFLNRINVGNSALFIGAVEEYKLEDVLYLVLSPLFFSTILFVHGLIKFNKKDLK